MAVKMRLTRMGDKKAPFYRVVVADSRVARDAKYIDLIGTYNPLTSPAEVKIDADERSPRDGKFIDEIGYYNPLTNPAEIKINAEKAEQWLKNGAQPTETVKALLVKEGIVEADKKSK